MIEALLDVAERERGTIVVAYTHGQPAQPTTYGHYLAAFIELSLRDMERLRHAQRTVDLSSMGAAAITTSGFNLDRARDRGAPGLRRGAGELVRRASPPPTTRLACTRRSSSCSSTPDVSCRT